MTVPSPTMPSATEPDVVLNATGYIVANHKIALAPKILGRVAEAKFEMGDRVHKGEVLVRLEDDEYRARLAQQQGMLDAAKAKLAELQAGSRPQEIDQAQASLDQANADMANAKQNADRTEKLIGMNVVSEQAIDDARGRYSMAKARADSAKATFDLAKAGPRIEEIDAQKAAVEQAQGQLDLANVDMVNTVIKAPIDGVILDRNVEVGEYVTTGFVGDGGAKGYVATIADLNDLLVELDISQNDFPKIAPNQSCTVTTDAYPDKKYQGVVYQISPQANRQKATVLVKVKIVNPDGFLRPDMNASVAFHPAGSTTQPSSSSASVIVPATAIRDGKVFLLLDGKAKETPVQVGTSLASGVRVTTGLNGGEKLIVNPPPDLTDGRAVKAKPKPEGGTP